MNYPDPHQGMYAANTPIDMGMSPEGYGPYGRPAQEAYPASMPYNANALYAEAPYMYNGRSSPAVYAEDGDMRVPSSNLSTASATSSNVGSPLSNHGQLAAMPEWAAQPVLSVSPGIVDHQGDYFPAGADYPFAPGMDAYNAQFEFARAKGPGFVDPSLIHPDMHRPMAMPGYDQAFQHHNQQQYPASPAHSSPQLRNGSTSPFMHNNSNYPQYSPYGAPIDVQGRRVSYHSTYSGEQTYSGDESKEKLRCPDCQKTFKDLKAHMLTHQLERPEKCPIQTCEYHTKGFARKYDKNRHTLTHYKGTMVCGFCPGSGSAAEKSFNRADVFKRHLTAVHGVEQTPPNSRKKTAGGGANSGKKLTAYAPDATGKCSTCSATFSNAQDFYEHLDDCVLRIVQLEDPSEAINAKRLAEVDDDSDVHATLEKNQLPTSTTASTIVAAGAAPALEEDEDEVEEDDDEEMADDSDEGPQKTTGRASKASSPTKRAGVVKSRGMTHSRGGVAPPSSRAAPGGGVAGSGGRVARRSRRGDYPSSWGFDKGQMTMKKRVMAVFDGPRRLAKDDMMLSTENEVRVPLGSSSDGRAYVTDLDVQTLKRAEGFLGATDAEKGPWISDDPTEEDLKTMLMLAQVQQ